MKKFTLMFAGSITCAFSFAQTIPNAGFETWVNNNESPTTYLVPQSWMTHDAIESAFATAFGDSTYVVHSVSRVGGHTGSYAAQMSVVTSNESDVVGGAIYSFGSAANFFSYAFSGVMEGFTISTRPANLTGYYKMNALNGDTAGLGITLTKWNTSTNSRDILTTISFPFLTNASAWTSFTIPLNYTMNEFPDSVLIITGISPNTGIGGQQLTVGSTFTIDDLAFTGSVPAGVQEQNENSADVIVYPNPFNEQATLKSTDVQLKNASLELYDVLGNKVRVWNDLSGNTVVISRDGLTNGIYFYQLINENNIVATGKITVE